MANTYTRTILEDGWRNAVVNFTGMLDTADANLQPAVVLSDFINNDVANQRLVGFRVDTIEYSIGDGIQVGLFWNAATPQQIAAIAGRGCLKYKDAGGLQPNRSAPAYDGSITLSTTGFSTQGVPPQNFTVALYLIKLYQR